MKVKQFMTTDVVAVSEDTSLHDAEKIMKAHGIRRLPVMRKDKLVGLVTERMLVEASASSAKPVTINELQYLLAKMTVKDIMVKSPFTVSPELPAEEAMELGQEMGYSGFPVLENGRLVGVVTESDIVRIMTRVLGVREKGKRIDIRTSKRFGNMKRIMKILDEHRTVLLSMMTLPPDEDEGPWLIVLRLKGENTNSVIEEIKSAGFKVTYVGS
jgi:acetoin utilization protein AcuB